MRLANVLALAVLGSGTLGACSSNPETPASPPPTDYWAMPDTSEGLVNVSANLDEVLQANETAGACERYRAGQTDRRTMLLCGKWMFFYEGFGTAGPPTVLLKFLTENFPDQIGPGFVKQGMILDPTSKDGMPLGLAPGAPFNGTIPSATFTCPSCHFAKLPDGRYAIGAPNHAYDYGFQTLAFGLFPTVALGADPAKQDPTAMRLLQPMLDRVQSDPAVKQKLLEALQPLVTTGAAAPALSKESQGFYASWLPGTQDFLLEPVPIDDKVHTISKITSLWGIPDPDELQKAGIPSLMLGWTGGTRSVMSFLNGFVVLGIGKPTESAATKAEFLKPLEQYIFSLRTPKNPARQDPALVGKGEAVFAAKGCTDCHGGPRGSGNRLYTFEEIGTDAAMKEWGAPELSLDGDPPTRSIKSPRLTGAWAYSRFLHNGSVATLEDLFCMNGPRGKVTELAYGDAGHDMTCRGLDDGEKRALIAFLKAN